MVLENWGRKLHEQKFGTGIVENLRTWSVHAQA